MWGVGGGVRPVNISCTVLWVNLGSTVGKSTMNRNSVHTLPGADTGFWKLGGLGNC